MDANELWAAFKAYTNYDSEHSYHRLVLYDDESGQVQTNDGMRLFDLRDFADAAYKLAKACDDNPDGVL